jgi:diadenosine tetraphosphate (Ap4A) HIT family hydrolase
MAEESLPQCPFCAIGALHPPSTSPDPNHDLLSPPAFVVLSTRLCLAFLDIMPLAPGHLLVTTRHHREKISEVSEDESRELGLWLPRLSRVLANVTGVHDWNIVQNNGAWILINKTARLSKS